MKQRVYIWIVVGIALLLLFGSCRSIRYVPVETIRTDSVFMSNVRIDSVYVQDSILIKEKGDTLTTIRYKLVYRYKHITDTLFITKNDSVQVPYPVEKELTWWQKTKLELGEFSIGIILILLIVVIWLVKKKGGAR
jgi:hypothetical protein